MKHGMARILLFALWGVAAFPASAAPSEADGWSLVSQPGYVLLLRHARAPGVGDPPGMELGDCATQRNLDARGREQAMELGARLRGAGAEVSGVYTSEWCRCRETAQLLELGPVKDLPALNSFYERPGEREISLGALREFIASLPRDGGLTALVTHQVTITALTGYFPASGEGAMLKLGADGGFEFVATLRGGG